jgi:uncharacterized protein (DUF433 family)
MKHYSERITIHPEIRFGKPCLRGSRISMYDVLGWLASGMSPAEVIQDFPELVEDDIRAVLAYAAEKEHKLRIAS